MGKLKPDAGTYYLGANVRPGYYEQNAAGLSGEVTAIEEIRNSYPRMSDTEIRCALAAFLFRGTMCSSRLKSFPAARWRG